MQIYKYISSKAIIEKVYRDTGSSYDLPWLDMIEWIFEVLSMSGHPSQYLTKICGSEGNPALDITNHKAKLPDNFHKLLWILVNGVPASLAQGGSIYLIDNDCCNVSNSLARGETFTDNMGNVFNNALGDLSSVQPQVEYDINNNYLTLSCKEGEVCIGYLAYPVDCEGFPEIPDHQKCKNAVANYLIMKLDYIGWRKGDIADKVYQESKREYEFSIASMINQLKAPDLAEMENLKNQVIRSIPQINEEKSLFKYLNQQERRRF